MSRRKNSIFAPVYEGEEIDLSPDVDESLFSSHEKRGLRTSSANIRSKSHVRSMIIVACLFFACITQLFYLQIVKGSEFTGLSANNRVRTSITPATRGVIKDRQGVLLAYNTPAFRLYLNEYFFSSFEEGSQHERLTELLGIIAQITGVTFDLNDVTDENRLSQTALLSESITYDQALTLMAWNDVYPEYSVESFSQRSYVTDRIPSLSHILGYVGKMTSEQYDIYRDNFYRLIDTVGQSGIEEQYESELRGAPARQEIEVNAFNEIQRIASSSDSIPGTDLTLTIDASLQSHVESVLIKRMEVVGHDRASVIVMDPSTGGILSLVSWPAYDANIFTVGDRSEYARLLENEDRPLFHRAISGAYPSGSTIKPLYSAAALIEGIVTPNTTFISTGGLQVGPWFFPDWQGAGGVGPTNVYKAIAESVNTYYYIIGGGYDTFEGLGIDRLIQYAQLFGLSRPTGIDEPGEVPGFLPSPEWKLSAKGERWYVGDTYNVSIGQGDVLTTPLQMARATAVFANGGSLVTPHLVQGAQQEPERIIDEDTARIIRDAMRRTVLSGTAKTLQPLPVTSAGKTGTAQWSNGKANHSWFVGYAPHDTPEVVITVLVEEDQTGYAAVPIVYDILRFWFDENNQRGTM